MKKGLTKTLMAVAVAVMAVQVMAMAPVIGDIPSPVVGNLENVTPAQGFVYPDAIDLTKYVTDPDHPTSPSLNVVWSYETVGAPKYSINGVGPLDTAGGELPETAGPAGAKAINTQVLGGEVNVDGNPQTITVRNIHLSPIVSQPGTDPGGTGVVTGETQLVTLYAGDGTTYSTTHVWFYSTSNERDRLSPGGIRCYESNIPVTSAGFRTGTMDQAPGTPGAATINYDPTKGLCLSIPAGSTTSRSAEWKTDWGVLPLVMNNVYKIRLVINGTQTTVGTVPLWDCTVNNFDQIPPVTGPFFGRNLYGANYFFVDNVGDAAHNVPGANAAMNRVGGTKFDFWWCPPPISLTRWNNTAEVGNPAPFAASLGINRDAFLEFRLLDDRTALNGAGANWAGSLCLYSMTIDRFNLDNMNVINPGGNPPYNATVVTDAINGSPKGNTRANDSAAPGGVGLGVGVNGSYTALANTLTLTPTAAGSGTTGNMLVQVEPGDNTIDFVTQSANVDNFPVPMDPQSLYMITVGLSAPTANDVAHPPDIFWIGADMMTSELINLSWVSLQQDHCGMPDTGSVQSYKAFFYSNYGTVHSGNAALDWWNCFRPRFMEANTPGLGGSETNVGAIRLHSWRVDKVSFE